MDTCTCARCGEEVPMEKACWSEQMQAQLCYECYCDVEEN